MQPPEHSGGLAPCSQFSCGRVETLRRRANTALFWGTQNGGGPVCSRVFRGDGSRLQRQGGKLLNSWALQRILALTLLMHCVDPFEQLVQQSALLAAHTPFLAFTSPWIPCFNACRSSADRFCCFVFIKNREHQICRSSVR